MTISQIKTKIQNAKQLDFGDLFNKSIELFKKVWIQGFVILLLTFLFAIPFLIVVYIPLLALGFASGTALDTESMQWQVFGTFAGLLIILLFIVMYVGILTVGLALRTAFYRIAKMKDFDEMGGEDYFFFLKKKYLKKTIGIALASLGIAIVAAILCYLPLFYAIVPLSLIPVIYAFNPDLSVSDIIKLSFQLGNKKWGITFGLLIVGGLLSYFVGILMCFIGVYFTISFAYLPSYFIYKEVIGFNNDNDDDEVDFNTGFDVKQLQ